MAEPPAILLDLPLEIIGSIMSRLPARAVLICKCVCKPWRELISSPEFAKFYLSASTPELLVLQADEKCEYLCRFIEHGNRGMKFDPKAFLGTRERYQIKIDGSVDGLLCFRYKRPIDEVIYVCNPVTREYIALPKLAYNVEYVSFIHYGFGVSSVTGQHKVVCMLQKSASKVWRMAKTDGYKCKFYEYLVYTLGAGAWRRIPRNSPFELPHLCFGLFLNGNVHGLVHNPSTSAISISCFDLEDESFKPFPPPPYPMRLEWFGNSEILGVLDGCLCICECRSSRVEGGIIFWTMKEYGAKESWKRQIILMGMEMCPCYPIDTVYPIKGYENGDILFSWQNRRMVFYYSKETETIYEVDISAHGLDSAGWFKAMPHRSSFLSLARFGRERVVSF